MQELCSLVSCVSTQTTKSPFLSPLVIDLETWSLMHPHILEVIASPVWNPVWDVSNLTDSLMVDSLKILLHLY